MRKTKHSLVDHTVQQTKDTATLKSGKWQTVLQTKHTFTLRGLRTHTKKSAFCPTGIQISKRILHLGILNFTSAMEVPLLRKLSKRENYYGNRTWYYETKECFINVQLSGKKDTSRMPAEPWPVTSVCVSHQSLIPYTWRSNWGFPTHKQFCLLSIGTAISLFYDSVSLDMGSL